MQRLSFNLCPTRKALLKQFFVAEQLQINWDSHQIYMVRLRKKTTFIRKRSKGLSLWNGCILVRFAHQDNLVQFERWFDILGFIGVLNTDRTMLLFLLYIIRSSCVYYWQGCIYIWVSWKRGVFHSNTKLFLLHLQQTTQQGWISQWASENLGHINFSALYSNLQAEQRN